MLENNTNPMKREAENRRGERSVDLEVTAFATPLTQPTPEIAADAAPASAATLLSDDENLFCLRQALLYALEEKPGDAVLQFLFDGLTQAGAHGRSFVETSPGVAADLLALAECIVLAIERGELPLPVYQDYPERRAMGFAEWVRSLRVEHAKRREREALELQNYMDQKG